MRYLTKTGCFAVAMSMSMLGCSTEPRVDDIEQKNMAVVRGAHAALANGDLKSSRRALAPDYRRHCQAMPPEFQELEGTDVFLAFLQEFVTAVPGYEDTITQMMAQGDRGCLCVDDERRSDRTHGRSPRDRPRVHPGQRHHPTAGERQDRGDLGQLGQRRVSQPARALPAAGILASTPDPVSHTGFGTTRWRRAPRVTPLKMAVVCSPRPGGSTGSRRRHRRSPRSGAGPSDSTG